MSYCDDCILLDICGKEGCCDEAMTFCADKNKFIYVSILDNIRDEIERKAHSGQWSGVTMYGMLKAVAIIDKYKAESEAQGDTK